MSCFSIFKSRGHQPPVDWKLKISHCNVRPILFQNGGSRISILIRFIRHFNLPTSKQPQGLNGSFSIFIPSILDAVKFLLSLVLLMPLLLSSRNRFWSPGCLLWGKTRSGAASLSPQQQDDLRWFNASWRHFKKIMFERFFRSIAQRSRAVIRGFCSEFYKQHCNRYRYLIWTTWKYCGNYTNYG